MLDDLSHGHRAARARGRAARRRATSATRPRCAAALDGADARHPLRRPAQRRGVRDAIPRPTTAPTSSKGLALLDAMAGGRRAADRLQLDLRDLRHARARAHGRGPPAGADQPLRRDQARLRARARRLRAGGPAARGRPALLQRRRLPSRRLARRGPRPEEHLIPLRHRRRAGPRRGPHASTATTTTRRRHLHPRLHPRAGPRARPRGRRSRRSTRGEPLPGLQPRHRAAATRCARSIERRRAGRPGAPVPADGRAAARRAIRRALVASAASARAPSSASRRAGRELGRDRGDRLRAGGATIPQGYGGAAMSRGRADAAQGPAAHRRDAGLQRARHASRRSSSACWRCRCASS